MSKKAVARRCSVKRCSFKFRNNSQENTCLGLQALGLKILRQRFTLVKKVLRHRCFFVKKTWLYKRVALKFNPLALIRITWKLNIDIWKWHTLIKFLFCSTLNILLQCSIKLVYLKISQKSQENVCARVSFLIRLQASGQTSTPFFTEHLRWQLLYIHLL